MLFGSFTALLALALVLHQVWWQGFEVRSPHFVVILTAIWVVLRPTSVARFLLMLAAETIAVAIDLPNVGDHVLLVLVTAVCVLSFVAWTALRTRRMPNPGELFDRMAPFLRIQLLILYAAAAVAKTNTDFFDPNLSCAAPMSRQVAWFDPGLLDGSWRIVPAIWGTVLVEAALPVLLAIPRTRALGLVVGLAFHAVLALAGNVPFSALAVALYVAFLPSDTPTRLRAWAVEHTGVLRGERHWVGQLLLFGLAVACWLAAAVFFSGRPVAGGALLPNAMRLVVLIVVAVELVVVVAGRGRAPVAGSRHLGHPIFALGLVLLVINALSPYLGLKTETTFTMFSNLRTEDGRWNHLFLPEGVRVFGYQEQPVQIVGTNDAALAGRSRDGTLLVPFELDRYLRAHPQTTVTYTVATGDGERHSAGPTNGRTSTGESILQKLVRFKDVPPAGIGGC